MQLAKVQTLKVLKPESLRYRRTCNYPFGISYPYWSANVAVKVFEEWKEEKKIVHCSNKETSPEESKFQMFDL